MQLFAKTKNAEKMQKNAGFTPPPFCREKNCGLVQPGGYTNGYKVQEIVMTLWLPPTWLLTGQTRHRQGVSTIRATSRVFALRHIQQYVKLLCEALSQSLTRKVMTQFLGREFP